MPADREEQAREIFLEAMALDHGRRERFIEDRCGSDAALRDEVASLLAHEQ